MAEPSRTIPPIEYRTDWLTISLIGMVFCAVGAVIPYYALWFKQFGWLEMSHHGVQISNVVLALFGAGGFGCFFAFFVIYTVEMIRNR